MNALTTVQFTVDQHTSTDNRCFPEYCYAGNLVNGFFCPDRGRGLASRRSGAPQELLPLGDGDHKSPLAVPAINPLVSACGEDLIERALMTPGLPEIF